MNETTNQNILSDLLEAVNGQPYSSVVDGPNTPSETSTSEILELGDTFDLDGFQVVRREFFAHLFEPSASFNNCKFYVNSACLARFPETTHVQVLINQDSRIMALRPCKEGERDSFAWCSVSQGKRKPKQTTCKLFFAKVVSMMQWNPDYRYKLLGRMVHANGEYLLVFDLTATEVYQRTYPEGAKPKTAKTPTFPADWQNQFGLPFREHRQSMQINIFDGYAIYALKENKSDSDLQIPVTSGDNSYEQTSGTDGGMQQ